MLIAQISMAKLGPNNAFVSATSAIKDYELLLPDVHRELATAYLYAADRSLEVTMLPNLSNPYETIRYFNKLARLELLPAAKEKPLNLLDLSILCDRLVNFTVIEDDWKNFLLNTRDFVSGSNFSETHLPDIDEKTKKSLWEHLTENKISPDLDRKIEPWLNDRSFLRIRASIYSHWIKALAWKDSNDDQAQMTYTQAIELAELSYPFDSTLLFYLRVQRLQALGRCHSQDMQGEIQQEIMQSIFLLPYLSESHGQIIDELRKEIELFITVYPENSLIPFIRLKWSEYCKHKDIIRPHERVKGFVQHAESYMDLGNHKTAINLLKQAIAIDPNNAACYHALSLNLIDSEQYEEAIEAAKKAIALDPCFVASREISTWELLAEAHSCHNANVPEAEHCYRKLLEITPNSFYGRRGLALALLHQAKFIEAKKWLLEAKKCPESAEFTDEIEDLLTQCKTTTNKRKKKPENTLGPLELVKQMQNRHPGCWKYFTEIRCINRGDWPDY